MAANGWPQALLGKVSENFDRVRVPLSSREREQRRGPIPYYGAAGVIDYVNESLLDGTYLLVGEDGSVETDSGRPVLQLTNGRFWVNNHAHVLRGRTIEETRFLYYALSTVGIHEYLSGSVQPKLTQENLNRVEVPYPAERERVTIARVLGSLDDKIELNRRMNRTLEQIAQALFKSWFVDFDPVRAKAEGRWKKGESLPGMPADMWALWPSEFEDSEIGEIPKGWEIGGLGTVASCTRDLVDPSEIDPELRYVGLEHIAPRSLSLWNWGRVGDTVSGKARFKQGEILFGKLRPYFHKVCIPAFDGVASTDILTVSPKTSDWFAFTLGHLDSDALVDYVTAASNGTKMPRTSWQDLAGWQVALPLSETAGALTRLTNPLFSKMAESIEEVGTLSSTRDALLPKLLSGEIRVPVNGGK